MFRKNNIDSTNKPPFSASDYQDTYHLRRVSPPGSPSPSASSSSLPTKKFCYEHARNHQLNDDNDYLIKNPSFFCCCYTCPGPRTTSFLTTFGICCLVLGYTIIGAFTFMALEGDLYQDTTTVAASITNPQTTTIDKTDNNNHNNNNNNNNNNDIGTLRAITVSRLWSITEDLNILYKENWTKLAAEEVLVFQDALFKALRNNENSEQFLNGHVGTVSSSSFYQESKNVGHKWSFSSSFLYSLTLITTIGYGSVSPRTSWGKLVTIIYALVGIPLMLLYLSTTGDVLARSFRRLYGKICGSKQIKQKPQLVPQRCPCSNNVRVPIILCLIIVFAYICSGAMLFHRLENWSILEGSYFCFTSLGTIGFGDLLPGQKAEDISLCACSAYILTGMALVAMCFSLVQDEVISLLRYISASCSKTTIKLPKVEEDRSSAPATSTTLSSGS